MLRALSDEGMQTVVYSPSAHLLQGESICKLL